MPRTPPICQMNLSPPPPCRGGRPCPPVLRLSDTLPVVFVGADAERSCSRRRSVTDAACPLRVLIGLRFAPPFPFLLQKRKRILRPHSFLSLFGERKEPCRTAKKRKRRPENLSDGSLDSPSTRALLWTCGVGKSQFLPYPKVTAFPPSSRSRAAL